MLTLSQAHIILSALVRVFGIRVGVDVVVVAIAITVVTVISVVYGALYSRNLLRNASLLCVYLRLHKYKTFLDSLITNSNPPYEQTTHLAYFIWSMRKANNISIRLIRLHSSKQIPKKQLYWPLRE